MRGRALVIAAAVAGALALSSAVLGAGSVPSTAGAVPNQDSAVGTGSTGSIGGGLAFANIDFNVTSGPSGENPTGSFAFDVLPIAHQQSTSITCLSVNGNTATFSGTVEPTIVGNTHTTVTVVDNGGAGPDEFTSSPFPSDCSAPLSPLFPLTSGDIVVFDAPPPPTSKEQCRNGGFADFGFKNQGECVAFVERGPKP